MIRTHVRDWPMCFLELDVFPWHWRLRPWHDDLLGGHHQFGWLMLRVVWLP